MMRPSLASTASPALRALGSQAYASPTPPGCSPQGTSGTFSPGGTAGEIEKRRQERDRKFQLSKTARARVRAASVPGAVPNAPLKQTPSIGRESGRYHHSPCTGGKQPGRDSILAPYSEVQFPTLPISLTHQSSIYFEPSRYCLRLVVVAHT